MIEHKEEVYLLAKFPYRDKDFVAHFLSAQEGHMQAVIKGGQSMGKASSFGYEPGDRLELHAVEKEGGEFVYFREARPLASLRLERASYEEYLLVGLLLDVVRKACKPHIPAESLAQILAGLHRVERGGQNMLGYSFNGLLQVLDYLGVRPDLGHCVACHRITREEGDPPRFRKLVYNLVQAGLLCEGCATIQEGARVTPPMLKALWLVSERWDYQDLNEGIPTEVLTAWLPLLVGLVAQELGGSLRSVSLLQSHFGLSFRPFL